MQVKIGELVIELNDDELTSAILNYVNEEEANDGYLSDQDFEICNISRDPSTGETKILFGERS